MAISNKFSIHPDTTVRMVSLTVHNLDRSLQFYRQVLGFHLHRREGSQAYLGSGRRQAFLMLVENPDAIAVPGTTGLYHFAVLLPSRLELARALRRLVQVDYPLQGFADHLVSEAVYFSDPDGNDIELYRDRPRQEWPYRNGLPRMATDPLDVQGVLAELRGENPADVSRGISPGTVLGHMHLRVADIAASESFYCDLLGFDLVMRYGQAASFVSAGGYHHHVGFNTWDSAGASPPPLDSIGLRYFSICLPGEIDLQRVVARLRQAELPLEEGEQGLLVRDPSGNGVLLETRPGRVDQESS